MLNIRLTLSYAVFFLQYDTVPAECHNTVSKHVIFKVGFTNILEVYKAYISAMVAII